MFSIHGHGYGYGNGYGNSYGYGNGYGHSYGHSNGDFNIRISYIFTIVLYDGYGYSYMVSANYFCD